MKLTEKMTDEEIETELWRLHAGCMIYYEMFDPEKHERYKIRIINTSDIEEEPDGFSRSCEIDVSGVDLWIKEVGLPYIRSKGVISPDQNYVIK